MCNRDSEENCMTDKQHRNHHDCHEHCHSHGCGHSGENNLKRIFISILLLFFALFADVSVYYKIPFYLAAYFLSGYDVIIDALKNVIKGDFFDENFLMGLATIGAFCIGEYPEAVSVMILYQLGEFFQHKAVNKSRKAISSLINIMPEYANVEENGQIVVKKPEEVKVNDTIIVKPGEKVPLDGVICEGHSYLDTSSVTGESILKEVNINDNVLSGSVNHNSLIKIVVTKLYKDSAVSKILQLVESAAEKKSKTEKFITKFSKIYTPVVVVLAAFIIIIPLLFNGFTNVHVWIERALTFLVISCPCALVISVPLTFYGGVGAASKNGILIKGSNYIEKLSNIGCVVFDKTGTLTKGKFEVTEIIPEEGVSYSELTEMAAYVEYYSNHPVADAVKKVYPKEINMSLITDFTEISGKGAYIYLGKDKIVAGNKLLMNENGITVKDTGLYGSRVYIAKNNVLKGVIVVSDEIKENTFSAIATLKKNKIKTVMLTGDNKENAEFAAGKIGIDCYYAELLPEDKVKHIEEIINQIKNNKSVVFAGDGINDAPVLMRSDVGIAMGALGSDAAIEAADVVITDDNPGKINTAVKIAKKTMSVAKQNITFAIGIKVLFLILGFFGLISMWGAVFADVGVTLIAVLNALRTLKK